MQPNQTTLYLHNEDIITYPNDRCSIQMIVCIVETNWYLVDVCLYPHNTINNLMDNKKQFAL
jgi:hypothetical protein